MLKPRINLPMIDESGGHRAPTNSLTAVAAGLGIRT